MDSYHSYFYIDKSIFFTINPLKSMVFPWFSHRFPSVLLEVKVPAVRDPNVFQEPGSGWLLGKSWER
jgi:hypothetical protein